MSIFLISAILFLCIITVLSIYNESQRRFFVCGFLKNSGILLPARTVQNRLDRKDDICYHHAGQTVSMTFDENGRADAAFSTFSASCFGKFENGCVRLGQEV